MGRVESQRQGKQGSQKQSIRKGLVATGLAIFATLAIAQTAKEVRELLEWGDNEIALERAEEGLEKTPDDAALQFYHAVALFRNGENDDALEAFEDLAKTNSDNPEVHNNLAVLYALEGEYEKARASLEAALATNETYATAHKNLSDIYSAQAAAAYNRALARDEQRDTPKPQLNLLTEWTSDKQVLAEMAAEDKPKTKQPEKPVKTKPLVKPEQAQVVKPEAKPKPKPAPVVVAKPKPEPAPKPAPKAEKPPAPVLVAVEPKPAPKVETKPAVKDPTAVVAKVEAKEKMPAAAEKVTTKPAEDKAPDPSVPEGMTSDENARVTPAPSTTKEAVEIDPVDAGLPLIAPEQAHQAAQAIKQWAAAWREQDVDNYIAAYARFFRPENGLSHKEWETQRRARVAAPKFVRIGLREMRIRLMGHNRAVANFYQDYQSDTYQDTVKKTLYLENIDGKWFIVREVSE